MSWEPRIVVFQCQYCLHSEADQRWIKTQLPENVKLIQVPCAGRISPLFLLNAVQGGADGILISGCMPERCHFKEGNLGARRQLDEFARFLSYVGLDEARIRFVWLEPEDRGRIQHELAELQDSVRALGPSQRLTTRTPLATGAAL